MLTWIKTYRAQGPGMGVASGPSTLILTTGIGPRQGLDKSHLDLQQGDAGASILTGI